MRWPWSKRREAITFPATMRGIKVGSELALRMEQAAGLVPPNLGCTVPPPGWWCSREPGHEGPCAARPEPVPERAGTDEA